VLLITDHGSAVDAIVQASRARGVVGGAGARFCEMRYVLPDQEVRVGDRVITSGMDLVFPKGLLIGIVSEAGRRSSSMFRSVELKPAVDFAVLENVLVVTAAEAQLEARQEALKNKTDKEK
jgi:rod shape-determining protein MreC